MGGGLGATLQWLYEFRRSLTLVTLVANLIFGTIFSLTTFNVVGRCLTTPCIAETETLLRINSGLSFVILLTGFLFILQPIYGLWFFKVKCTDVVGGGFVGATIVLALQAMMTSSHWASIAQGVRQMDPIVLSDTFSVKGNETYLASFQTLSSIAAVYCALAFLNALQLSFCLEFFCDNDAARLRAQRFAERIKLGYQYQGVQSAVPDNAVDDQDLDDDI
mmetsp:Transcript_19611/g.61672  ORF Transcript_19611/g.61672 Transcript_19611/m.61672 type:complete len:220 (+) Transcript_19611:47-706(+)